MISPGSMALKAEIFCLRFFMDLQLNLQLKGLRPVFWRAGDDSMKSERGLYRGGTCGFKRATVSEAYISQQGWTITEMKQVNVSDVCGGRYIYAS